MIKMSSMMLVRAWNVHSNGSQQGIWNTSKFASGRLIKNNQEFPAVGLEKKSQRWRYTGALNCSNPMHYIDWCAHWRQYFNAERCQCLECNTFSLRGKLREAYGVFQNGTDLRYRRPGIASVVQTFCLYRYPLWNSDIDSLYQRHRTHSVCQCLTLSPWSIWFQSSCP